MSGNGYGVVYGVLIIAMAGAIAMAWRWWRLRSAPPRPDPAKLAAELLEKRRPPEGK